MKLFFKSENYSNSYKNLYLAKDGWSLTVNVEQW